MGEYPHDLLEDKTLFLIFYNQSLRTRNSFEAGMTHLGGHAHYLDPSKIYTPAMEGREVAYSTERISDVARTLAAWAKPSRFAATATRSTGSTAAPTP